MSKESEKIFRDLNAEIARRNFKSKDEEDQFIRDYMKKLNEDGLQEASEDGEPDEWDYLEMAEQAKSKKEMLRLASEALRINPDLLDAKVLILSLNVKEPEELKAKFEEYLAAEEKRLKEKDGIAEDDIGSYWGLVETRPYMRLKNTYVQLLVDMGKYGLAAAVCEEMLKLCGSDNLGIRYTLMALYAFFEDERKALKLNQRYQKEESAFMLLPLAALNYKLDQPDRALEYLKMLSETNPEAKQAFRELADEDEYNILMDRARDASSYAARSKEEIITAIADCDFLYLTTPAFIPWACGQVRKMAGRKHGAKRVK